MRHPARKVLRVATKVVSKLARKPVKALAKARR